MHFFTCSNFHETNRIESWHSLHLGIKSNCLKCRGFNNIFSRRETSIYRQKKRFELNFFFLRKTILCRVKPGRKNHLCSHSICQVHSPKPQKLWYNLKGFDGSTVFGWVCRLLAVQCFDETSSLHQHLSDLEYYRRKLLLTTIILNFSKTQKNKETFFF